MTTKRSTKNNHSKKHRKPSVKRRKVFHRRTKPGAPPGTLVSDKTSQRPSMRLFRFEAAHCSDDDIPSFSKLPEQKPGELFWLDVVGLGDAGVIDAIGKRFSLHPLALEDVLHVHQRAKVEEYHGHIFIVVRMLTGDGLSGHEQVSLFVGENFVITFQEKPGDCFDAVRARLRQDIRFRSRHSDYLAYALIDAVIDAYFPRLEHLGETLDEIDEAIIDQHGRDTMVRLHAIRRELVHLRKLLWQLREAMSSIVRLENPLISTDTKIYFRDCLDHTIQLIDVAEVDRETCTGLQEFSLSETGQRSNDVMKMLTLIATLFMPMSFVAGVYGMNFDTDISPWNMPELDWMYGYPFALGIMALMGFSLTAVFWLRGWFRD